MNDTQTLKIQMLTFFFIVANQTNNKHIIEVSYEVSDWVFVKPQPYH